MEEKKKSGRFYLALVVFSFISLSAFGASKPEAKLGISSKKVEVGEMFILNIEISGEEMSSIVAPQPPNIPAAKFLQAGSGQRINSFTVSNAQGELEYKSKQTQVYSFTYMATKAGQVVIPPLAIKMGDDIVKTAPGSLQIVPQGAGGGSRFAQPQLDDMDIEDDAFAQLHKMEDQFNQLLQRKFGGGGSGGFQAVPNLNEKDTFVIVAEVDKTTVFKGEQITASWYLYTRAGVREIDTLKYPSLKGFWKEDIELATLLNFQPAELNKIQYNKALLASYALFPIEEGKSTVDPYRAKVTVVGGFGQGMTVTKDSESIPILVKPLPKEPAGGSLFSGAVGEFQIKADLDDTTVVAHQPFSVKIHVEGRGNAKQFELPSLNLPPDVEVYDIKKDAKFFKTGMSYKEFEVLLIPRKEGDLVIPSIKTTIFNPRTEKYEELATAEIKVRVLPGSGQQGLASSRVSEEKGGAPEKLNLITQWEPQDKSGSVHAEMWLSLFIASFIGLLAFASLKLGWFKKSLEFKDYFSKRLKQIHKKVSQEKWREVGVEATNLAYFVLGDISGQGGANLQVEKLLEKSPPSVRREIGEELKNVMNKFYLLGFGPDLAVQAAIKEGSVKEDIKKLEKLLWKAIELSHADIPK